MKTTFQTAARQIGNFLNVDCGATTVEYAFMLMLILMACIGAIALLGGETGFTWTTNSQEITTAIGG